MGIALNQGALNGGLIVPANQKDNALSPVFIRFG